MEQKPNDPFEGQRRLYWLAVCNIIYRVGGVERSRMVNVLTVTSGDQITAQILGRINQSAQVQALEQEKIPKKAEIVDVVNMGFSLLGLMAPAEFAPEIATGPADGTEEPLQAT